MDFKKAFAKGIEAHETAEALKKEILDTISEASRQLSEYTEGAVKLEIGQGTRYEEIPGSKYQFLIDGPPTKRVQFDAIYAVATRGTGKETSVKRTELCEIEFSKSSYPFTLRWPGKHETVYDNFSLEKTLEALFTDPVVAGRLKSVQSWALDSR